MCFVRNSECKYIFCFVCHRALFLMAESFKKYFSLLLCLSPFLVSVTDAVASAAFQTMLTVCHRKRPKLCKQLLKRIMEYLTSRSAAPGVRSETTRVPFSFCPGMSCSAMKCHVTPAFVLFFLLVLFWSFSRTRPPVASLRPSYSYPTSPFSVTSTRTTSRVSWWTWPSTPSPTSPYRG